VIAKAEYRGCPPRVVRGSEAVNLSAGLER
jgi:hypothetical protein